MALKNHLASQTQELQHLLENTGIKKVAKTKSDRENSWKMS